MRPFSILGLVVAITQFHTHLNAQSLAEFADGKRDATAAIQSLVDQKIGRIELPAGTFRVSKTINIPLHETGFVAIEGSPATKLVMTAPGPLFFFKGSHFKSADPGGFSQIVWDSERMPSVTGIAIEGKHADADGIASVGTMQLTVSRVHLRKLRHGIHLLENNRNVLIESCHIYENRGVGIFYDDVNLHQSNIVGCHISYCDQGGIVSRRGNVRNIHITGCDLESNMSPRHPPTANVFIDSRDSQYGTAEVAISGCTIQHNADSPDSANIRIIGRTQTAAGEAQQEGHVTITGNVLSDVSHNIWLESCRGVTIVGNSGWMGFEHNLLVESCSHIIVGSNNFDRNPRYNYGRSLDAKNRLVFRDCRDCTLTGFHIAHVSNQLAGLSLERCDRFNVSGLTILDCDIGLSLQGVTRSRFSNCMVRDDRPGTDSIQLVRIDSTQNEFDDSFD